MIKILFRDALFGDFEIDESLARLVDADGLDAGCVEASVEPYAGMGGGTLTGVRLGVRTIRLTYAIVGDPEESRDHVYGVFQPAHEGMLDLTTNGKHVTIGVCVSQVDCDLWSANQEVTVTLTCPDPWFYSTEEQVYEPATSQQWTITQNRGSEAGFVAQVKRSGYVRYGGNTGKLAWDCSAVLGADAVLTLDMREGHRDLYIETNGVRTSYLQYITEWYWQMCPHLPEGRKGIVRSTAVGGTLTFRERWAGL